MTLSEIIKHLESLKTIEFKLPNGTLVPRHFHVTEVGKISKTFIDCGGKLRQESKINFQLWEADDYDHRLHPEKLLNIIKLSKQKLGLKDLEIEVEYQTDTIGKFNLDYNNGQFLLVSTKTACLALDSCGMPSLKPKLKLSKIQNTTENCCTPESGCC